jgi:membrane associated rhomboid family serine protease
VTWALIALNVVAFLLEVNRPEAALQTFIESWGVVPREYAAARDLAPQIAAPFWTTLFTSMFLHGGWMHLGGNMLYLWIFGDNIERAAGGVKFLIFYLACGLAASAAHILFNLQSPIPAVGASGAISGVLGGYLLLFPTNRVRILTRGGVAHVPALVVLGFWIVLQFINGIGSVARTDETAGVAYMAHIGGFVAGLALVKLFAGRERTAAIAS